MMITEVVLVYNLDHEFDKLFRDLQMEDTGYDAKCAEKASTTRDGLVVAVVRGVTGKQMVGLVHAMNQDQ